MEEGAILNFLSVVSTRGCRCCRVRKGGIGTDCSCERASARVWCRETRVWRKRMKIFSAQNVETAASPVFSGYHNNFQLFPALLQIKPLGQLAKVHAKKAVAAAQPCFRICRAMAVRGSFSN